MSCPSTIELISECFIKPKFTPEEEATHDQPIYLSPWDLSMISLNYIQKGLLFPKPPQNHPSFSFSTYLNHLKYSLSATLSHFHPLAARLATLKRHHPPLYTVYIDPKNNPGAKFIHATANLSVSDIQSPPYVPSIVHSLFDHDKAINHDGHTMSLLSIQVTELTDGIFIGCSINHMVADGASFWHFFNSWSELFRGKSISRLPLHQRWIPDGYDPIINLPFTHHDQFIDRQETPPLRERIFHFSSASLKKLKAKANSECNKTNISTLQALSALVWICLIRSRNLPIDQETSCWIAVNTRHRIIPNLSNNYFGNSIETPNVTAKAGELLKNGLGWAAWLLNQLVADQNDKRVRESVKFWLEENPHVYSLSEFFDGNSVMIGSSPRFDMYGNEFGLGKALAIRSGFGNKFDGKVTLYPGFEGEGSMDLEVCVLPDTMSALESDEEYMDVVSKLI